MNTEMVLPFRPERCITSRARGVVCVGIINIVTSISRPVSRQDLSHQIAISQTNRHFPGVPASRLIGFPYL